MWHTASGFKLSPDLSAGHPQGTVGISINSLDAKNNTRYVTHHHRWLSNLIYSIVLQKHRCSSVCAYYMPFSDRPNLTVLTGVLVSRILWEQPAQIPGAASTMDLPRMKAAGVEFNYTGTHGQPNRVYVGKEVILAAGALGSPKVLELSGVGNSTYV